MKIMIDTNVIISAVLFPNGRAAQAFLKALLPPYIPLVCDYIVDDLFLTGDKDFLESSITDPRIISVSDFLNIK